MNEKCVLYQITCPPLIEPNCVGFTPPGACCPVCGGAIKLLYSKKQIDRALYALRGQSLTALTLKSILMSLQRHIQVAECAVRGYVTVELDLFVMVQSTVKEASDVQLEACVREAEKLAGLIKRHSARIASELSLSSLTVAMEVHTTYGAASSAYSLNQRLFIQLFALFICLLHFDIRLS
jgi:reversion-inducing-cysteine-rich protein with kazal motifs